MLKHVSNNLIYVNKNDKIQENVMYSWLIVDIVAL